MKVGSSFDGMLEKVSRKSTSHGGSESKKKAHIVVIIILTLGSSQYISDASENCNCLGI